MIRRAVLEIGRRLEQAGRVKAAGDVFEAEVAEVLALVAGTGGPTAEELAERAACRAAAYDTDPPVQLGEPLPPAPAPPMPAAVQRLDQARASLWSGPPAPTDRLRGTGIGTGTAR